MSTLAETALMVLGEHDLLAPHRAALAESTDQPAVRLAWAAARIVMRDSYAQVHHSADLPGTPEEILEHVDWVSTLAQRRRLNDLGFGIAEAMDTAQRYEVGWPVAERLIRATAGLNLAQPMVAGAGIDHLRLLRSTSDVVDGVVFQARFIAEAGGIPMLLCLPELLRLEADEETFVQVYEAILRQLEGPVFLHWLGEAFHPGLAGYFPGDSFARIMALDPEKVRGVKLSLLDPEREVAIRHELLPRGQVVLTGDDLAFAQLIEGQGAAQRTGELAGRPLPMGDFSHALLGAFDAVAEPMSVALRALARGDVGRYRALAKGCERLASRLFEPPVAHYKAGLAFLAWLGGLQPNAMLPNHAERLRDREHFLHVATLAALLGALADRNVARVRLARFVSGKRS